MEKFVAAIKRFAAADVDCYLYSGKINRAGYVHLCRLLKESSRRLHATLVLSTLGGDPNAAYRIARALLHHYDQFSIIVPEYCKSAGTLLCIGASELVLADRSELGPLDMQIQKPNEPLELGSGLDLIQSVSYVQSQALSAFKSSFTDLKFKTGFTTKIAADVATNIAAALYAPIQGQIDPVRLGELNRIMMVAQAYGGRLNKKSENLQDGALDRLSSLYPSHSFVIDRSEAKELFKKVRSPNDDERDIVDFFYSLGLSPMEDRPVVADLCSDVLRQEERVDDGNVGDAPGLQEQPASGE